MIYCLIRNNSGGQKAQVVVIKHAQLGGEVAWRKQPAAQGLRITMWGNVYLNYQLQWYSQHHYR